MMPATLDPLQHVEKLMRGDRCNRTLGDAIEEFEEPARLLDGGGGTSLPLHLLDIFPGDERERCLRRQFGLQPPLALFLDGIDPVIEFGLGLVALPARLHQGDIGKLPSDNLRSMPQHR